MSQGGVRIHHGTLPQRGSRSLSRRTGRLPWLALLVWSTWIFAVQGRLGAVPAWGRWVPDVGLLLILSLDALVVRELSWRIALVVALARIATSADPPLAVLVAYLGVVGLAGPLRELVLLDRPLARSIFAGIAALLIGEYLFVAQRAAAPMVPEALSGFELSWRSGLATGLFALVLLPLLCRLPGLSPLLRVRG